MDLYYIEGTNGHGGEKRGFTIRTEVMVVWQAWQSNRQLHGIGPDAMAGFHVSYYVEGTNRLGGEERAFNIQTEVTVVGQAWAE